MILQPGTKVDFTIPGNFSKLIGFDEELCEATKVGSNMADFLTVKEYVIHCDIIDSKNNYLNEKRSQFLHVLPVIDKGDISKQVIYNDPSPYCPILGTQINRIELWITDQNGEKINFHKYPVTYLLELV